MDIKKAKAWIKKHGLLIKNVKMKLDEHILDKRHYDKLYRFSKGSFSGEGFCFFYMNKSTHDKDSKGVLFPLDKKIEEIIFKVDLPS